MAMLGSRLRALVLVATAAVSFGASKTDLDFVFNAEEYAPSDVHHSHAILISQGRLQTYGNALSSTDVPGDLQTVCERTKAALFAEAPSKQPSGLPGAPVYRECMAALAPIRAKSEDSNAIDTLSDCMALVNALVTHFQTGAGKTADSGSACSSMVSVLEAHKQPPAAKVVAPVTNATASVAPTVEAPAPVHTAVKPASAPSKASIEAQTEQALQLVTEAMTDVCTQTVHQVEGTIKKKEDAMKLGNAVAPICQDTARQRLGVTGPPADLLSEWCHQLDGRLTLALQTGFFFALEPVEAQRQAREANPYATTTRRHFCSRFVASIKTQAEAGGVYIAGPPPSTTSMAPTLAPQKHEEEAAPTAAAPAALKVNPAEAAEKVKATAAVVKVEATATTPEPNIKKGSSSLSGSTQNSSPLGHVAGSSTNFVMHRSPQTEVDMLHLVQALSQHDEWKVACNSLVSRLTSEEGSVLEEVALGGKETPVGTKVLTFNAQDQAQLRTCSAQLKVLAVRTGAIVADAQGGVALIETQDSLLQGAESTQESSDALEALVDSPWSYDACADMAHGFLSTRLVRPASPTTDFCSRYAQDLQAMREGPKQTASEAAASQDAQKLRSSAAKRHSFARRARPVAPSTTLAAVPSTTVASAAPSSILLPAVPDADSQAKRSKPAFLNKAAVKSQATADDAQDGEGLNFWSGMLQD